MTPDSDWNICSSITVSYISSTLTFWLASVEYTTSVYSLCVETGSTYSLFKLPLACNVLKLDNGWLKLSVNLEVLVSFLSNSCRF